VTLNPQPISDQTWAEIRAEFTLPALGQVRRRLSELIEDPEPVMQQLVRVFIDDGTFCLKSLDDLTRVTGADSTSLLDAAEVEVLEIL
jgi:hypothetical protein